MAPSRAVVFLLAVCLLIPARIAAALGASTYASDVTVEGGIAYFTSGIDICRTDGTEAGTRCFPFRDQRTTLAGLRGKIYVIAGALDGPQSLYEFDGTQPPRAILPLQAGASLTQIASNGKQLFYFNSRTIFDGLRLMHTDGTAAGTGLTRRFNTNDARMFDRAGESIFFLIADTSVWTPHVPPRDLWMSNGTSEGTALLEPHLSPPVHASVNGVLVYPRDGQLWRTDGTVAGTYVLAGDVWPGRMSVREPFAYFFSGSDLWRTDGTEATILRHFPDGVQDAVVASSRLIAMARQNKDIHIWSADAAGGEPEQIATIPFPDIHAPMPRITSTGVLAFFVVRSDDTGDELWRTDGTAAGTFSVTHARSISTHRLTVLGDRILFFADDAVHGMEPWISDGTREGTRMIANLTAEGFVHGRVTDAATGAPIEDAIVQIGNDMVRTDADGHYEFIGVIGSIALQVLTDRHVAQTRMLDVHGHDDLTIDFALQAGAHIAGRVTDPEGHPLPNLVATVSADDGSEPLTVYTDANGAFSTPPLSITPRWSVSVPTQGLFNGTARSGIVLAPYETHTVELPLMPFGVLRVRLIDAITGGAVRTNRFGSVEAYEGVQLRDGATVYRSTAELRLADGEYQLAAHLSAYHSRWLDGDACGSGPCAALPLAKHGARVRFTGGTTTSVDFVVQPIGGSVRAFVVDEDTGVPVRGMFVSVAGATSPNDYCVTDSLGRCETQPVYADGTLTVAVSPGYQSSYLPAKLTTIKMRFADDPRPQVKVHVTRGATLTGLVTDRTGRPVFDAYVVIGTRSARTDATGRYFVRGIASGTYDVTVDAARYAPFHATGVVVTNGETTTLDVTMQR